MNERILVVEDDPILRDALAGVLTANGFSCATVGDAEAGLAALEQTAYDVVLADVNLPKMTGIELVRAISGSRPDTFCLVMTAFVTVDSVLEALRAGAADYLPKPVNFDEVVLRVKKLLDYRDRLREIKLLRRDLQRAWDLEHIVGRTEGMKRIFDLVQKVSATRSTALITGESGTGKELVARAIHYGSELTKESRFVAVNCAAIPDTLLESELFGYVRGAFTGAAFAKKGLFEAARGGSILLDEIGEMSPILQAKLLRAVESREFLPVGSVDPVKLDARIMCSTNRDLKKEVESGKFREDLYYRIHIVEIHIPPLRERREDIPHLVEHFLQRYNRELKRAYAGVEPEALRALTAAPWKGNVRELENVIERAMILGDGERIRVTDLPPELRGLADSPEPDDLRGALAAFEKAHLERVLRKAGGVKAEAARLLGIGVSSLYRKMESLGLPLGSADAEAQKALQTENSG